MPSFIYCKEKGELVPKDEYLFDRYIKKEHLHMTVGNEKVNVNYISDIMEPTRHMADGKYYTSKAAFRAATRAAGCVEVGNETKYLLKKREPIKLDKKQRRENIKKAINDLKWGNVPRQPTQD